MRQGQNSKRSRGRGRKPHNNFNRTMDSNGPDVKIRGTASHIHEKYQQLARDAHASGDRISAENYLQHAEHYHRVLVAIQANAAQNAANAQQNANQSNGAGKSNNQAEQNGEESSTAEAASEGERSSGRSRRRNGAASAESEKSSASADAAEAKKESDKDSGKDSGKDTKAGDQAAA